MDGFLRYVASWKDPNNQDINIFNTHSLNKGNYFHTQRKDWISVKLEGFLSLSYFVLDNFRVPSNFLEVLA